ncbi:MAG: UvrD-helicase domain-containing protein, partial [Lachnospiraceae bacterium]|nr:UvrD-helicase domain-containing protein [Lachnospiraceae bacterium]
MAIEYTKEQQLVIDLRGKNILVSAAAGSGKTAVLSERIVNMVCDRDNPVDIDRLLVVTFTNAAAAEMKERVLVKLNERLLKEPDNDHIRRQTALVHSALITTIDSFALYILRNHFNEIGFEPDFKVADENEGILLREQAGEEVIDEGLKDENSGFSQMVDFLFPTGGVKDLESAMDDVLKQAEACVDPEEWLRKRLEDYEKYGNSDKIRSFILEDIEGQVKDIIEEIRVSLEDCEAPGGPTQYIENFKDDLRQLEEILEATDTKQKAFLLENINFTRLSGKKNPDVDPEIKERVQKTRDNYKKAVDKFKKLTVEFEVNEEENSACAAHTAVFIKGVLEYRARFMALKSEKKLVDFGDMEHFALKILYDKKDGKMVKSRVSREYATFFKEVLVDEYQDSNMVQEALLKAVTGEDFDISNYFCVGDVKQSIYRFRMADPTLFMDKYNTYKEEGDNIRIDLSANFRSRETVVDTVNHIFENLMSKEKGGIEYDKNARLYAGLCYPEGEGFESEFYIVPNEMEGVKYKKAEAEISFVAHKIKELVRDGKVTDKNTGELRPVRYSDIVIL